ncbi:MAG: septum formation initiator family protein [Candidatus Andersenbacteria bacterium]|nr:septum formation initiator family protein [bacterium]MDZ4225848.1 septum formation initiator family protein [Candidatus Andersenbacteria bacterium]
MNILQPKIVVAVVVVVVLGLLISLAQEMNRRLSVQREVNKLEKQVQDMQKSAAELENLNQYFNTDAYQDRLAREKLNYRAPGEKVVLIPNEEQKSSENGQANAEVPIRPVPERWWRIFFVGDAFDFNDEDT